MANQTTLRTAIEAAKNALHRISLASQNSMSSKEECGRIARETIPTLTAALTKPDAGEGCVMCGKQVCVGTTMEIGPFCREHWEPIKAKAVEVQRLNDAVDAEEAGQATPATPTDTPPPSPPSLTREEWRYIAFVLDKRAERIPGAIVGVNGCEITELAAKCRAHA